MVCEYGNRKVNNPFGNTNFKAIEYACSSKPGKEAHMQSWMNCNRTLFNPALIQAKPGKRGPLKIHEWPHPVRGHCLHDEIMCTYVMLTQYKREGANLVQAVLYHLGSSLSFCPNCVYPIRTPKPNHFVFSEREREQWIAKLSWNKETAAKLEKIENIDKI